MPSPRPLSEENQPNHHRQGDDQGGLLAEKSKDEQDCRAESPGEAAAAPQQVEAGLQSQQKERIDPRQAKPETADRITGQIKRPRQKPGVTGSALPGGPLPDEEHGEQ